MKRLIGFADRSTTVAALLLAVGGAICLPTNLAGQGSRAPAIDTVVIHARNVFEPDVADKNFIFRFMNRVHVTTRPEVIARELLLRPGEPYDSVRAAESERILRARELFQSVGIDTARVGGRLGLIVDTQDGWSLKPRIKFTVASDGTWSGQFGATEVNLLGTGNLVSAAYLRETDRRGPELMADFRRVLGTELGAAGNVTFWNDGTDGFWRFGDPWVTDLDSRSIMYDGEATDRRVLQYRVDDSAGPDTTFYQREAFVNRLTGAIAPFRTSASHFRVGAKVEVRQERYFLRGAADMMTPDTTYGEIGVFVEYSRSRFQQIGHFNGFATEDIDVSNRLKVAANVAASSLGYRRSGIGPRLDGALGARSSRAFLVGSLASNGLFTGAGLDSGRVVLDLTFGFKPLERHSTVLYITAGAQEDPPPGQEFDLGFITPPRSWQPHSFVGTRMVWGTLEHRWFAWEGLFDLISIGLAGFFDYGGAWYPDQDARFGGNIGIGLRTGGALSTSARTGRIDFGCRLGEGSDLGDRCVVTFGAGFVFPWNPYAALLVKREYQ